MNENRPATSKARGTCRYYNHPRGCYAGDKCKFLHADPSQHSDESKPLLTPYDQAKRCKFYAKGKADHGRPGHQNSRRGSGFCKRGDKCWFIHDSSLEDGEREDCSICFETPATYGLLSGCSHIFCIGCIRQWREVKTAFGDPTNNIKKCPMCRTTSQFITPSSKFWKEGDGGKSDAITAYKESMSRVSCKYFQLSKERDPAKPACPFGKDCFYQHLNDDGTKHVFTDGIDVSMRQYNSQRTPFNISGFNIEFGVPMGRNDNASEREINAVNLAGNIAIDMFDRMVAETQGVGGRDGGGTTGVRGQGRTGNGRRGIDEATLDRARFQMVAGAMVAIQAELGRLEGSAGRGGAGNITRGAAGSAGRGRGARTGGAGGRPVVVPGTLAPSLWDLDVMDGMPSDNDDVRGGWGWNNLLTDIGIGAEGGDAAVMERLEILAEHMLASLQSMGREDDNEGGRDRITTPPPPLEPFLPGRDSPTNSNEDVSSEALPPPLEPVNPIAHPRERQQHIDDDLPSLESVSNSSESEVEQSSDEGEEDEVQQRPDHMVRAFDLAFRRSRSLETSPERASSWPLFRFWGGARRSADVAEDAPDDEGNDIGGAGTPPTATSSRRFSTIVGREERMVINVEDSDNGEGGDEAESSEDSGDDDQEDSDTKDPVLVPQEPPFMTDGRGRVIWSNSGTNKSDAVGPTDTLNPPRTTLSNRSQGGGDGIGPTPEPASSRSLIGRVLGAFF